MPNSFFDGGTATLDDARRLADHLAGRTRLAPDLAARADLDGDGRAGTADLLLLLRLATDPNATPADPSMLYMVEPSMARPGDVVSVRGVGLQGSTDVLVRLGRDTLSAQPQTLADAELTFIIPAALGQMLGTANSADVAVQVLSSGVASNTVTMTVVGGPLISSVEGDAANSNHVTIHGVGFGTEVWRTEVTIADAPAQLQSVADDIVEALAAAPLTDLVSVAVYVDGVSSNVATFLPNVGCSGRVVLPAGSPLALTDLIVDPLDSPKVQLDTAGVFAVRAPLDGSLLISRDGSQVLGALCTPGAALVVDATSTAIWAVFFFLGAPRLPQAKRAALRAALAAAPTVTALASAMTQSHAAHPLLEDLFAQATVGDALQNALIAGQSAIDALP